MLFAEVFPRLPDTFFWYLLNTIRVLVMMVNYLQKGIKRNFEARKVIENVPMSVQFLKRQCILFVWKVASKRALGVLTHFALC